MPTYVSLLRGINVGGHKKIKMADLRALYESQGFRQTRTLLQSGNAVFRAETSDLAQLKRRLEDGIHERFGFEAQVILRSLAEYRATLDHHAFSAAQLERGNHALILFLSAAPDPVAVEALRANNPGREEISAAGDALYVFYTDGVARSKLDTKRIERALNLVATARNWNTCQRILKLAIEVGD